MKYFVAAVSVISLAAAIILGNGSELSDNMLSACESAVELFLSLLGIMAFWGGVMEIAERSRLTDKIAALFSPILRLLFRGIKKGSLAYSAIAMNITANLLGLGNAATPIGIDALKKLKAQTHCGSKPNKSVIYLTLFNTASIQLIPTTVAAIRSSHGSKAPMEIILPVLFTSFLSLAIGLAAARLLTIKSHERG